MKQLTVVNLASDTILCTIGSSCLSRKRSDEEAGQKYNIALPSTSVTLQVASFAFPLTLMPQGAATEEKSFSEEKLSVSVNAISVRMPMSLGALWKTIRVPEECPWVLYRSKISRRHHRLLVLPKRDPATFLRDIPDTVPLSSLMLPGTHDTMALYGWPISQCQALDTPLTVQLASGIRVLDIRLAVKDGQLIAYHGVYPQRAPFQYILATIHDFLTAPATCRETLVMSIKQEDFATVPGDLFSQLVHEEILGSPGGRDMWFLDNRIPLLGQVRGKVVMFSRFGGNGDGWDGGLEGIGIHPTTWPDSAKDGFSWDCKNTLVRTHDWYNIPSFLAIPEKTSLATNILLPPINDPPMPSLAITFFSASSFPLAFPPTVARGFGWPKIGLGVEGVNARVGQWLMDQLATAATTTQANGDAKKPPRIRGWALMDFYEDPENALAPLLIECNFRGRVTGEEGWA